MDNSFHSQNKPAAQAAGADPFRCNFNNRQNLPIQQNRRNSGGPGHAQQAGASAGQGGVWG